MITSTDNKKIKDIIKLRKANKRRNDEIIAIEGKKEIEMAASGSIQILENYISESVKTDKKLKNIEVVSDKVFKKICWTKSF